jgi:pullulanase
MGARFGVVCLGVLALCACARFDGADLAVHYYRFDRDYDGWNVWVWPAHPVGEAVSLAFGAPDADGFVTARTRGLRRVKEFGMIVRKSEGGNDWADKDTPLDRFSGGGEVWLVEGDAAVYHEKPDVSRLPVRFAVADAADSVVVYLFRPPAGEVDAGRFVVCEEGRPLDGQAVRAAPDVVAFP